MKQVRISKKILEKVPDTKLGIIYAEVKYEKYNPKLWEIIQQEANKIKQMTLEQIKLIPQIEATRKAYKLFGKEPARYRPSAEALYRRIIQGKGLYQISNIVDLINLASLQTGFSIGGYDYDKIQGNILFDLGTASDQYYAIGRGLLNIENLPVFRDSLGAFGSPTTDSQRTMITEQTEKIFLIVVNFGTNREFLQDLQKIRNLILEYAEGKCFQIEEIEPDF